MAVRMAVRDTAVSRYYEGLIEHPLKPLGPSQQYCIKGFKDVNWAAMLSRDNSLSNNGYNFFQSGIQTMRKSAISITTKELVTATSIKTKCIFFVVISHHFCWIILLRHWLVGLILTFWCPTRFMTRKKTQFDTGIILGRMHCSRNFIIIVVVLK